MLTDQEERRTNMPKYKAKINGQNYTLKDGFTIAEEMNETLDSGNFIIETEGELDFESFDDITIFDDSETPSITEKKQLINDNMDEIAYFMPSVGLENNFNTFSRTKGLERVTCPNLTTTKCGSILLPGETVTRSGSDTVANVTKNSGVKNYQIYVAENFRNLIYNSITV